MSSIAVKRLANDYKKVKSHVESKIEESSILQSVSLPVDDDLFKWQLRVKAPPGLYTGGVYNVELVFPERYPCSPPVLKFITPIYNPAVSDKGEICQAALSDWKPTVSINDVLINILERIFVHFQELDPLNEEAAKLYAECKAKNQFDAFTKKIKSGKWV